MGNIPPPTPPILDPTKWYCLIIDKYDFIFGGGPCDGPYLGISECCWTGANLAARFGDVGWTCQFDSWCPIGELSSDIPIDITGPYDTENICNAACF